MPLFELKYNDYMEANMKGNVFKILLVIFVVATTLVGCNTKGVAEENQVLTIFAAASLTDALNEIKGLYEGKNNTILQFNFAASGTLQKQIEEGAPADVFISAGVKQMDELQAKELIVRGTRQDLLKNSIVLIGAEKFKEKIHSLEDLQSEDIKYVAIGTPETVPAGQYTKESLEYYKLWELLGNKFVFTKDVRQVLTYVESGNAEVGFIYQSDALVSKNTVVILEIPEVAHKAIVYPAAVVKGKAEEESRKFLAYLNGKEARIVFEKYGYVVNK